MSGVAIKTTGTTEPKNALYISVPVNSSELELFLCTTAFTDGVALDLEKACRNYAKNKNDAVLIGNPPIAEKYTSISGGNGFRTDIKDSADFTMFTIARSTGANTETTNRPFFIGSSNGPVVGGTSAVYGTALGVASNTGLSFQCARGNTPADQITGTVSITVPDVNNWHLVWARSNGLKTKIKSETANVELETTFALPRLLNQNKVAIGSNSAGTNGSGDIFRAVVFSRALSDEEIKKMVMLLRAHAAARSITV